VRRVKFTESVFASMMGKYTTTKVDKELSYACLMDG
jgi:hypothetical protein